MAANLAKDQTKILYLPLKDEKLPNLTPHTTLTQSEHSKLSDIKSNTFDVCTGITKKAYPREFINEILRTLKPGGIVMIQVAKEIDFKKDLLYAGFTKIDSNPKEEITHVKFIILPFSPIFLVIECKDNSLYTVDGTKAITRNQVCCIEIYS